MSAPDEQMVRVLRSSDHRRMAWKNGQGETIEVAIAPEGAGLSGFDWRVSMASVAADGPFSAFPGIDRTLAVLSGDGIRLTVDGQARDLTVASAPFLFPADRPTQATLLGGPVTDLNVTTRRDAWTHQVRRADVADREQVRLDGALALALCAEGSLHLASDGASFTLGPGDALAIRRPAGRAWQAHAAGSVRLCLMELTPAPTGC